LYSQYHFITPIVNESRFKRDEKFGLTALIINRHFRCQELYRNFPLSKIYNQKIHRANAC